MAGIQSSCKNFLQELLAKAPDFCGLTTLHNHGKPSSVKKKKNQINLSKISGTHSMESLLRVFSSKSGKHPRTADGCISGLKMIASTIYCELRGEICNGCLARSLDEWIFKQACG
jgi:hypothetical protein